MKTETWILGALAFFLVLAYAGPGRADAKTAGKKIIDGKGRTVLLRGVNLGNWLVPEGYLFKFEGRADRPSRIYNLTKTLVGEEASRKFWEQYRKTYITEDDIRAIAAFGFNSVRVPLHYSFFTAGGNEEGFKLLDRLVKWCGKHKIYVILDMHCAPGGQTGTNIDDNAHDKPDLWTSDANKLEMIEIWRAIARYAKESAVAGYDLLNEPVPSQFSQFNGEVAPYYKKLISAIRKVDSGHIIFIEGTNWATGFDLFSTPPDANMVYSFHKYWNEPDRSSIEPYLKLSEAQSVPLWAGETGENSDQWYSRCVGTLEENGIGWCFWPWKKVDSANNICSISKPAGWDEIIEYTRGGEVPSAENAKKALAGFLENAAYAKCVKNMSVVKSLIK